MATPSRAGRGCLPVIGILVVIGVVSLGGWVLSTAAPRRTVVVTSGLAFRPPAGWVAEKRISRGEFEGVMLTNGSSHATVVASPSIGQGELISSYVATVLERDVRQATLSDPTDGRIAYAGVDRDGDAVEGELDAVTLGSQGGAIVDGRSPKGEFPQVRSEIRAMARTLARAG